MSNNIKDFMSALGMSVGAESYKPTVNKSTRFANESFISLGNAYKNETLRRGCETANFHIDMTRIVRAKGEAGGVQDMIDKAKSFAKNVWEAIVAICKKIVEKIQGALDAIFDNETKFRKGIDSIGKILSAKKKDVDGEKVKDKKFKLRSFAGGPSDLEAVVKVLKEDVDSAYTAQEQAAFSTFTSEAGVESFLTKLYPNWKQDSFTEATLKEQLESKKDAKKASIQEKKDFKEALKEEELPWSEAHSKAEEYLKKYQGLKDIMGDGSITKKLQDLLKNMKQMQKTATAIVNAGKLTISGDDEAAKLANKAGNLIRLHLSNGIMKSAFDLGKVKATFGVLLTHMKQCSGVYLASNYNVK